MKLSVIKKVGTFQDYHLYEIVNSEVNDTFKYGISGKPLNLDGTSPRANEQLKQMNLASGYLKFFANILLFGISGRREAKRLEKKYGITDGHGEKKEGTDTS
jgi:hypothetical protein